MEQRDTETLNQNKRSVKFSARGILFPKAAVSTLKHILILERVVLERHNVWRVPFRIWTVSFGSIMWKKIEKINA